jgi:hypothetical protein
MFLETNDFGFVGSSGKAASRNTQGLGLHRAYNNEPAVLCFATEKDDDNLADT